VIDQPLGVDTVRRLEYKVITLYLAWCSN